MADNSKKRKPQAATSAPAAKKPRFPLKQRPVIATSSTSAAYPDGELNVSRFLFAHENEIKSLEAGIKAAKKGLSRRAFQDVPRDLRRRTGSHNPQRVPKRLRPRAQKEAKEDNTPLHKDRSGSGTGKSNKQRQLRKEGMEKAKKAKHNRAQNKAKKEDGEVVVVPSDSKDGVERSTIAQDRIMSSKTDIPRPRTNRRRPTFAVPPTPPSRFRRRQVHKTWLPTHVWHAKRATMTPPNEPLWRFALPLSPAVKGYRLTHRAGSLRGAVAWDMSYMSTIGLEAPEGALLGLLRALHFQSYESSDPLASNRGMNKWLSGKRAREGWLCEIKGMNPRKLTHAVVIWSSLDGSSKKRKAFVRIHPSAFIKTWDEIVKASKMQKPNVSVEDLRFEIGSIEVTGPAAAEALCAVLSPVSSTEECHISPASVWPILATVTDIGMLPPGAVLSFPISDPRLRDPLTTSSLPSDTAHKARIIELLADWPVDETLSNSGMFDRNARLAAGRSLPSQKSINRRKNAATPGQNPETRSTDPRIPMLTYASRTCKSWTVLLPWKCVLPVWRCLMRYPVSTGGNPRFGGLKERQQLEYERSVPSFPFDLPATDAGWAWELQERTRRQLDWTRRPKGKRVEWSTIDLGDGRKGEIGDPWACDWARLSPTSGEAQQSGHSAQAESLPFQQLSSTYAVRMMTHDILSRENLILPSLFTVKISMVDRGVPQTCARIYRLPTSNLDLRKKWLSLIPSKTTGTPRRPKGRQSFVDLRNSSLSKHARSKALAARLLGSTENDESALKANSSEYPIVPDESDLVGYVTTGNYNLAEGRPTAIGNLALHKILESADTRLDGKGIPKESYICVIRDAGQTLGRLAKWEII